MMLDKSPTQEEFIRGHLTNNPYNSAEVGPLMRDVKNFICRELDMEGKTVMLPPEWKLTVVYTPVTSSDSD